MAEQIVHADIRFAGSVGFNKNYTDFPQNPKPQTIIVKGGIPYIYADMGNGFHSWYPMATKQSSYIHSQGVASTTWVINHNLDSVNYGLFVYDENHDLQVVSHIPLTNNTVEVYFAAATLGSAVIFAVESFASSSITSTNLTIGTLAVTDDSQGSLNINGSPLAYKQFVLDGLALKSNVTDVFASLALKSDKTSVDASLALKANSADVYLKSETLTEVQTNAAIQAVVDAAPEALNTLREIALELQADDSAAGALTTLVATKASSVDVTAALAALATVAHSGSYGDLVDKPTSLSGYGITDALTTIDITSSIAVETSRASDSESVLTTNLASEISRAISAEALLATKETTYTKTEVDTAVALKAVAATTYSKAQVDAAIAGATPSFSTLTGKPTTVAGFGITDVMTATTAQAALDLKANQATTYTKIESDARIQSVVGAAPLALDTLVEIAAQLASDESAAAALVTAVSGKVDKVTGKGLSTEDYTSAEKTKLAAVTGSNTGDETLASIKTKLGVTTLSGSNTGDQAIPTTLPASDVSAWAKSATKPTYTATEVGLANVNNTTDLLKPISTAAQTALDLKANQATTYTKTETDSRIQTVIGAAPLALDTLVEIAAQLASDESAAAALVTVVSGKVDKVTGKSLSAEDFSTVEKTKLAAVTGSNTGDETLASIKAKLLITTLSGSNTGDQVLPTLASLGAQAAGTYATGTGSAAGVNTGDQTTISGNAGTATKLASVVNINGVAFDGSAAITINAVDTTARVASSLLGAVSGVATLDADGKLTAAQATQNTSLVGLTFTTPSIIVASGSVVLTLSGTSTLVGGVIDRFEVTDWNSALTTVVAASNAGSKTLTATATIGQVLSISVVAIDSYGNRSAPIARTITVVVRAVNAMSITSPANNATGIGQDPVISGNSFSVNGGADTQVSADWEVWTGAGRTGTLVWSSINDTVNKTSITMPLSPILASSTVYYIAARYKGTTLGYGGYGYSSFTTVAVFVPTVVGTAYQGGFYAGKIKVGTLVYALVVSPKSSGDIGAIYGYTPTGTGQTSTSDGLTNSLAGAGNGPISPIRGLTIGGYVDWYLPAKDELEILYRNLKPTITANSVTGTNGLNANSIPVGNAYSLSNPTLSVSPAFAGGVESLTTSIYWTSTTTATPSTTQWAMTMHDGAQVEYFKTTLTNRCRAVRRVLL